MPQPFHLAIPVHDLRAARSFYGELFDCAEGRSSDEWVDFDFFGHQLVVHLDPGKKQHVHHNEVDGHEVPVPHFGVVMEWGAWQALAERLRKLEYAVRNRTRNPFRGPGGRAGDDVSLRSVRQRARVQGVQGSVAAVREVVVGRVTEVARSARLTSFVLRRAAKFRGSPSSRRAQIGSFRLVRPCEQCARKRRRAAAQVSRVFLEPAQRARQIDFLAREIGAEGILGEQPRSPLRGEGFLESLGCVAADIPPARDSQRRSCWRAWRRPAAHPGNASQRCSASRRCIRRRCGRAGRRCRIR